MKHINITLEGEYAEIYDRLINNFKLVEYGADEVNKRLFVQGMMEAADQINRAVANRNQKQKIPFLQAQDPETGRWFTVGK